MLKKDKGEKKAEEQKGDKIRYQYDEHYFLTDPEDFIMEFWPFQPEWQLLERSLTLKVGVCCTPSDIGPSVREPALKETREHKP